MLFSPKKKNNNLRRSFFKSQYRNHRQYYLKRMRRVDGEDVAKYDPLVKTPDVSRLPFVVSHDIATRDIQNYTVFLRKNFYTIEPYSKRSDLFNNTLEDVRAHASWARTAYDSHPEFLRTAKKHIKKGCFNNKFICNPSLINECNCFLMSNKYKLYDSRFTDGDDEYAFFYYRSDVVEPIEIVNELFTSFMADYTSTVRMVFSDQPPVEITTAPRNKDMYVNVYTKLVIKSVEDHMIEDYNDLVPTAAI